MSERPIGEPVDFTPRPLPSGRELPGRYVTLRALDPAVDAEPLHEATRESELWDYLFDGPFASADAGWAQASDRVFYAAVPEGFAAPRGFLSYLRIEPAHGTIEIGNILLGSGLARTRAGSEAIYLLAREAFDALGYRRLEWKCNALNAPSRRAAERLGFEFEGVFAQHMVVKGRNRDTAWYAITDRRWPAVRAGFEAWLDPENFDSAGQQNRSLSQLAPTAGAQAASRVTASSTSAARTTAGKRCAGSSGTRIESCDLPDS
jgi:RimJ/RimL family protein N-acetyltransferase